ncbi:SMP-30/gluconolactonase/LRE family protein [Microcoleus sp. LEGE 07076]|uniref:SMP-30/gluconolactonase/LRE family protein n=1 Tax=Microcoleus sp. LEGE 07076 TaxID=915322 RepID=UPI001D141FA1|nr:SMP-30/gluconolactonase/LRE family protein [Microcoleus sp. LEGE 07076]
MKMIAWSDAHGNRLLRWSPREGMSVLRDPSDYQSGNYHDREGRLVSCSSGLRAIVRREHSGEWQVLVDRYRGSRLNSPNDLVVKSARSPFDCCWHIFICDRSQHSRVSIKLFWQSAIDHSHNSCGTGRMPIFYKLLEQKSNRCLMMSYLEYLNRLEMTK